MKVRIVAFVAGVIGALGLLLFLVAFGTDYWLLATENCAVYEQGSESEESKSMSSTLNGQVVGRQDELAITFHHEGFIWRCWFTEDISHDSIWNFWFTNQPPSKYCIHGYLFPFPISMGPVPSHDSSAVYRGFWTAFIIVGVAAGLVGGLLLVCAVSFTSAKFYKAGGGFLLASELCHESFHLSHCTLIIDLQRLRQQFGKSQNK
ncbi:transmembrane protein 182-like isoform X5 [Narcine bancroftii]|uniref:transmembrane protein 182-like isoform X5 n=1 Tax=Narcine bancroftii TaxID=1343680 RepID=UPI00383146CA